MVEMALRVDDGGKTCANFIMPDLTVLEFCCFRRQQISATSLYFTLFFCEIVFYCTIKHAFNENTSISKCNHSINWLNRQLTDPNQFLTKIAAANIIYNIIIFRSSDLVSTCYFANTLKVFARDWKPNGSESTLISHTTNRIASHVTDLSSLSNNGTTSDCLFLVRSAALLM